MEVLLLVPVFSLSLSHGLYLEDFSIINAFFFSFMSGNLLNFRFKFMLRMLFFIYNLLSPLVLVMWMLSLNVIPFYYPLSIWGYLHLTVLIYLVTLLDAKMRTLLFRVFIAFPATFYFTTLFYSLFFMPVVAWVAEEWAIRVMTFVPVLLGGIGLIQSVWNSPWEIVEVNVDGKHFFFG